MAGTGAETITGGSGTGADYVQAGAGNATLFAGSGADLIGAVRGQSGGSLTIAGFRVGTDRLDLQGYGGGMSGITNSQVVNGSTALTLVDGTHVTLLDVTNLGASRSSGHHHVSTTPCGSNAVRSFRTSPGGSIAVNSASVSVTSAPGSHTPPRWWRPVRPTQNLPS